MTLSPQATTDRRKPKQALLASPNLQVSPALVMGLLIRVLPLEMGLERVLLQIPRRRATTFLTMTLPTKTISLSLAKRLPFLAIKSHRKKLGIHQSMEIGTLTMSSKIGLKQKKALVSAKLTEKAKVGLRVRTVRTTGRKMPTL